MSDKDQIDRREFIRQAAAAGALASAGGLAGCTGGDGGGGDTPTPEVQTVVKTVEGEKETVIKTVEGEEETVVKTRVVEKGGEEQEFDGTFTFGFTNPVTGPVGESHEYVEAAAALAVEEINNDGGIEVGGEQLRLDYQLYDSQCKADQGVSAFERLIEQDEVSVVLGDYCSHVTLAMMEVAGREEVPLLTSISVNPKITDPEHTNTYMFRNKETSQMRAEAVALHVADTLDFDSVGMLAVNDDYGRGSVKEFSKLFEERGVDVTTKQFYAQEQQDFTAELTKIKNSGADVMYLVSRAISTCVAPMEQAKQVGIENVFASTGCAQNQVGEQAGDAATGVYVVSAFEPQEDPSWIGNFVDDFNEKAVNDFGRDLMPNFLSAPTYDAVYAIADAVERADSRDPDSIRTTLDATELDEMTYSYPDFHLEFDEYGQAPVVPGLARFQSDNSRKITYRPGGS